MRIVKSEHKLLTKAKRLTLKWYKPLINTYDVVCIFFYSDRYPGNERGEFGYEYDKAANIIANLYPRERYQKGQAIMVKVNLNDEKILTQMFNVWCTPSYFIVKDGEHIETKRLHSLTTEDFLQFIEQYITDKKKRLPVPDTNDRFIRRSRISHQLSMKEYKNYVTKYHYGFVFIYAYWYQACRDALPIFEKANLALSKMYLSTYNYYYVKKHPQLALVRLDIDPSGEKKFGIKKHPTFRFLENGHLGPKFNGECTEAALIDFVKTNIEKCEREILQKLLLLIMLIHKNIGRLHCNNCIKISVIL